MLAYAKVFNMSLTNTQKEEKAGAFSSFCFQDFRFTLMNNEE